jgi:hypothetical protein
MAETMVKKKSKKTEAAPAKDKKLPELVCSFNVMCSNHRHTVGVTPKGRLYFAGHTIKELEREITFSQMGGQPCKCADILQKWRKKQEYGYDVPVEFKLERENVGAVGSRDDVARRAVRRRLRKLKIGPAPKYGLDDKVETTKRAEACAQLLLKELRRRGLEAEMKGSSVRCSDLPKPPQYGNDMHELGFRSYSGNNSIVFYASYGYQLGTISSSRLGNLPIKQIADLVERRRVEYLIGEANKRNYDRRLKDVRDQGLKVRRKYPSKTAQTVLTEHDGLYSMTVSFDGLTVQALEKMLEAYEAARGRMLRFDAASRERADNENRFPRRPQA